MKDDHEHLSTQRRLALVEHLNDLLGEREGGGVGRDGLLGHEGDLPDGDPEVVVRREGEERGCVGLGEVPVDVGEDDGEVLDSLLVLELRRSNGEGNRVGSGLAGRGGNSLLGSGEGANGSVHDSSSLLPRVCDPRYDGGKVSCSSDGQEKGEKTHLKREEDRCSA